MARNRGKMRSTYRTLLICGEGKTEKAFANFLKNLLVERNSGVKITIDSGNGGSPSELIRKVSGKLERRKFNDCIVMMDTDLPWPEPLPKRINKTLIHYLGANPCIEGVFLKLLKGPKFDAKQYSSPECKRFFHEHYLREGEKYKKDNYHKIFKKQMLLKGMGAVPDFAQLLRLMGISVL